MRKDLVMLSLGAVTGYLVGGMVALIGVRQRLGEDMFHTVFSPAYPEMRKMAEEAADEFANKMREQEKQEQAEELAAAGRATGEHLYHTITRNPDFE